MAIKTLERARPSTHRPQLRYTIAAPQRPEREASTATLKVALGADRFTDRPLERLSTLKPVDPRSVQPGLPYAGFRSKPAEGEDEKPDPTEA